MSFIQSRGPVVESEKPTTCAYKTVRKAARGNRIVASKRENEPVEVFGGNERCQRHTTWTGGGVGAVRAGKQQIVRKGVYCAFYVVAGVG